MTNTKKQDRPINTLAFELSKGADTAEAIRQYLHGTQIQVASGTIIIQPHPHGRAYVRFEAVIDMPVEDLLPGATTDIMREAGE